MPPPPAVASTPRHRRFVRVTHWLTVFAVFALLVSGVEIVISHPRFYWGQDGSVNIAPLFTIPIPSSRATLPTRMRVPHQLGCKSVKYINRTIVADTLDGINLGTGEYAWYAGI